MCGNDQDGASGGVTFAKLKEPAPLALNPFGQIPTYEEDGLVLFETGAIVLHIALHHAGSDEMPMLRGGGTYQANEEI